MVIRDTDDLLMVAVANERREKLKASIAELPERQRIVITLRYGLDGGKPHTLAEIADELNARSPYNFNTPERVRTFEAAAIRRLRDVFLA